MSDKQKLGMIAGDGMMPVEIIKHCNETGIEIFVAGIEPYATAEQLKDAPHIFAKIGEAGKIIRAFRENNVRNIVMAGGIKRPSLKELVTDWEGAKILAKMAIWKMGDDGLLRAVISEAEKHGFNVIGVDKVLPGLIFSAGIYGKIKPSPKDMDDIRRGMTVAKVLGSVDVGQGCVVQEGVVLAAEAYEGTDLMLSRAAVLKKKGREPILVKALKPIQDERIDLPAIGLQTIKLLKEYGFKGVAIEAGANVFIECEAAIKLADESGIFIIGVKNQN
jgi:hypothetical protein